MSIVKYKLANGQIAVYESTSYYDPEKKQARPKRKYLGMEDPVTGELVPSSGKRGRRRKQNDTLDGDGTPAVPCGAADARYEELQRTVQKLSEENQALRRENEALKKEAVQYRRAISSAISALNGICL